jgi:organic hydroperoxide reductase OsmC/OhrA
MSTYTATILWTRAGAKFTDNRYSRAHRWQFDGGVDVPASSSPHVVRVPLSDPAAVDPEEAFVASLASCHMLFFLSFAAREGFCVDAYTDEAIGTLAPDANGRVSMTEVTLRPLVNFSGEPQPDPAQLERLHHEAHEACYIASSVRTLVRCSPREATSG